MTQNNQVHNQEDPVSVHTYLTRPKGWINSVHNHIAVLKIQFCAKPKYHDHLKGLAFLMDQNYKKRKNSCIWLAINRPDLYLDKYNWTVRVILHALLPLRFYMCNWIGSFLVFLSQKQTQMLSFYLSYIIRVMVIKFCCIILVIKQIEYSHHNRPIFFTAWPYDYRPVWNEHNDSSNNQNSI